MADPTDPELAHARMYRFMLSSLQMNEALDDVKNKDIREIAKSAAGLCKRMFENPDWKDQ